ncbi:hypothetical protein OKW34_007645 [Paraburkholderia youngii]
MSDNACFRPRVIEPVVEDQPEGLGLAVELWFAQPIDGIAGACGADSSAQRREDGTGRELARPAACVGDTDRRQLSGARYCQFA